MSVIFYHDEQQKSLAETSLKVEYFLFLRNIFNVQKSKYFLQSAQADNRSNITTQILPAETFYNAEKWVILTSLYCIVL